MLKSVSDAFERLAERCLALAAGLLASTIEAVCLRYEAERRTQIEELACAFEADGLPDVAAELRDRARHLAHHNPAAAGEALLRDLAAVAGPDAPAALALPPQVGGASGAGRRSSGRPKRGIPGLPARVGEPEAPSADEGLPWPPTDATIPREEGR